MANEYKFIRLVMKSLIICTLFLALFALVRGSAIAAEFGMETHVPTSMSQISDPTLRSALSMYKPDYDALDHQSKVAAYVNIYRSLYSGATPALTAYDSQLLSASQVIHQSDPTKNPDGTHRYEPWQDPDWHPLRSAGGILGFWYD